MNNDKKTTLYNNTKVANVQCNLTTITKRAKAELICLAVWALVKNYSTGCSLLRTANILIGYRINGAQFRACSLNSEGGVL